VITKINTVQNIKLVYYKLLNLIKT